jgi:hypothetical protein
MVEAEGAHSSGAERNKDESRGELHGLLIIMRCQRADNAIWVFHWNSICRNLDLAAFSLFVPRSTCKIVEMPKKFLLVTSRNVTY